jgi:hypothetical protein
MRAQRYRGYGFKNRESREGSESGEGFEPSEGFDRNGSIAQVENSSAEENAWAHFAHN